jgi:ribose/xylose/arabinose/galactoside ABC-type transport system permease subunit
MPKSVAKPDLPAPTRRLTLGRIMVAIGFLAVDLAVVGSLRLTGGTDRYASFFAGALTTGYLATVFLAVDRPDETIDHSRSSTRPGPPG